MQNNTPNKATTQQTPRIPHNRLTFDQTEVSAVSEVVASGYWAGGPRLNALEDTLKQCADIDHAIGVASGLSALRLVLKGLGIKAGDEVIVPAYSCVALPAAATALGATAVPVDICHKDWNLDAKAAANVITSKTKAVITVNTFGAPASIEDLKAFEFPIIEDCAHGFGLQVKDGVLGSRSGLSILSFYATKLIGAGEGGAVLTDDAELAAFIRDWRDYGDQPLDATRLNDKMNDLEAALALAQLQRLDDMLHARQRLADRYQACLSALPGHGKVFQLPPFSRERVWYRYVVDVCDISAETLIERLDQQGIHAEKPVTDWRTDNSNCPVSDHAYAHLVSLPLYPTLTEAEQDRVCEAFSRTLEEFAHV